MDYEELNKLIDRSFEIIKGGLDSPDEYKRMRTALDLTQSLIIAGFARRVELLEKWPEEIKDRRDA